MTFTGYYFRSNDRLLSELIVWLPSHGMGRHGGWIMKNIFDQLAENIDCEVEDLQTAVNDWERWQEKDVACLVYSIR